MVIQWLRLHTPTSGGMGVIPGWGAKIPHVAKKLEKKKKTKFLKISQSLSKLNKR